MTFPLTTFQALSRYVGASNRPGKGREGKELVSSPPPRSSLHKVSTRLFRVILFVEKYFLTDVAVYALSVPTVVALHSPPSLFTSLHSHNSDSPYSWAVSKNEPKL